MSTPLHLSSSAILYFELPLTLMTVQMCCPLYFELYVCENDNIALKKMCQIVLSVYVAFSLLRLMCYVTYVVFHCAIYTYFVYVIYCVLPFTMPSLK